MSPRRAARACAHPGCPNLVRGKNRRHCDTHQSEEWKRQDAQRGSAAARGYDAQWQQVRDRYLQDNPRCARCGARAEVVHHIVRKSEGGSDDPVNLQALCKLCHARIHARAKHLFGQDR